MPTSPNVNFKFVNDNVEQTTPSLGISCMLARTTKGPVNDPSTIIQGYAHFQRVFGEEVLTEGNSVSPVQKALEGGSKLRIIRVAKETPGTIGGASTVEAFEYSNDAGSAKVVLTPLGNGDLINGSNIYKAKLELINNEVIQLTVSDSLGEVLETANLFRHTIQNGIQYIDASGLLSYARTSEYLKLSVTSAVPDISDLDSFATWLSNFNATADNSSSIILSAKSDLEINTGNAAVPTQEDWENAFDALLDYTDVYQVTCSNINHQPVEANIIFPKFHKHFVEECNRLQEYTYYIEVPCKDGNLVLDAKALANKAKEWQSALGYSEYVAYFTGGLKYYDGIGVLTDTDCIGAVVGLGDTSATNYGPWRSFAGMNRGLIPASAGPVIKNYGSPSRYDDLNLLANNYLNVIVIKDTPSSGKSTMLWHLFTSKFRQDSEKFLAIVRLNLYLKKTLRPLLEKYIEEPNIWSTWMNIYLEAKPILDSLVDQNAMSEYTWMGDQNAASYNDLVVNNEADVRQGKYKIILKYKDIVPMQEIFITLHIDQASKAVDVSITQ